MGRGRVAEGGGRVEVCGGKFGRGTGTWTGGGGAVEYEYEYEYEEEEEEGSLMLSGKINICLFLSLSCFSSAFSFSCKYVLLGAGVGCCGYSVALVCAMGGVVPWGCV